MREAHNIIAAHVGRRLRELRGERTQKEFAERLALSQAQYNRYETGKRLAPDRVLAAAAAASGLSPEQVVWGEGAPAAEAADLAREIAALVALLDDEAREDLYIFLKSKAQDLARRRRAEARRALKAIEGLKQKAL
ncbi:MAG: XRE family transcriptional regulator [Desulfarculus sp.]|nr:MAG: XRE family transcriptional regulator [Desulfarculus sp.]